MRNRLTTVLLIVVLAAGLFLAGYGAGQRRAVAGPADDQGFDLLRQVLVHVRRDFLTPAPESQKLFDGAAKGMLEALGDPYTRYMAPGVYKEFSSNTQGFFFGIGIYIDIRAEHLIVVQPIEGTPAHKAGLRAGDRIRTINGVLTDGMSLQEAVTRIRGPAGTKVTLKIARPEQTFDVEITRARIEVITVQGPSVLDEAVRKQLTAERMGYVRIFTFNEVTAREALAEFDRQVAGGASGLIIDLRSNGGGLLDITVQVANRLIESGKPILHIVARDGSRTSERARSGAKITIPIVVLVNEYSASASEILTGALKDSAGATVVGQKTFGKGVIQSVYSLPGGGGAAITTAKYLTPADHDIHGKGITPDVPAGDKLEGKSEADIKKIEAAQLSRAIDVLKQRIAQRR
jgi:carboxyl-terminal processing protease